MRLRDKIAIIIGAGQSPGEGMGNGRASGSHRKARPFWLSTTASGLRQRQPRW